MQRNMFGLCCQSAVWQLHYIYLINSFYSLSTLQPTYYIYVWYVLLMSWVALHYRFIIAISNCYLQEQDSNLQEHIDSDLPD